MAAKSKLKALLKRFSPSYSIPCVQSVLYRLTITDDSGGIVVLISPHPTKLVLPGDKVRVKGLFVYSAFIGLSPT